MRHPLHKKKNTIFLFDEKFPHSVNTHTVCNQVKKFRYKFHASTTKHVFILFGYRGKTFILFRVTNEIVERKKY